MTAIELYFKPKNLHAMDTACQFKTYGALSHRKWDVVEQTLMDESNISVRKLGAKTDIAFSKLRIKLESFNNALHKELSQFFHTQYIIHVVIIVADTTEPLDELVTALFKASGFMPQIVRES